MSDYSTLRLQVKTPDGQGYDLSSIAQGLQFSNVRPGGDENCTFTLRKSWLDTNPQVKRGSIVRVLDGLDVLWQGRLEELDRGAEDVEVMQVTAYGLGARLKDGLFRQIFVDRDLESWTSPSRSRKINLIGSNYRVDEPQVTNDTTNGLPGLITSFVGAWSSPYLPDSEAWYDAGSDGTVSVLYYDYTSNLSGGSESRTIFSATSDDGTGMTSVANLTPATSGSDYVNFSSPPRYAAIQMSFTVTPQGTEDQQYYTAWRKLAVYGNHRLPRTGTDPGGFTADQIIGYILGLVSGIKARSISSGSFVITQFVIDTPTHHEDAIGEAAGFEVSTWGTWGPNSVLDRADTGYFDFTVLQEQNEQGDWIISRADCDDIDLHDELGSLYNKLRVSWQDSSGEEFVETRTATIPVLEEAGLGLNATPREQELDAGPGTQAIAQQLADTYFGIQGTDPPSRGSVQLTMPVKHVSRGTLPPHYMRADGSTVKIRDVLPRSEAISLGRADRRTIFPIQRVTVDASDSAAPQVSVDLDQTPDRLSVIQARMAESGPAYGGGSPVITPPVAAETQTTKAKKKKGKHKRRKRAGKGRK